MIFILQYQFHVVPVTLICQVTHLKIGPQYPYLWNKNNNIHFIGFLCSNILKILCTLKVILLLFFLLLALLPLLVFPFPISHNITSSNRYNVHPQKYFISLLQHYRPKATLKENFAVLKLKVPVYSVFIDNTVYPKHLHTNHYNIVSSWQYTLLAESLAHQL